MYPVIFIFSSTSIYEDDHEVVVVGWGTYEGIPYWIIKNSWGHWWGDNGYIKLKRGRKIDSHAEMTNKYNESRVLFRFSTIMDKNIENILLIY